MTVFAAQPIKSDQKQIIESLSRDSELPIDEVTHLYEHELAELSVGARITSFLPIFVTRNVKEALRKRSEAARRATSQGAPAVG